MTVRYSLAPELRVKLKKPLGTLIRGSSAETMKRLKEIAEAEKPTVMISVGDTVTRNFVRSHLSAQLSVVDNRVMRRNTRPVAFTVQRTIHVENPPGVITEEAITAIQEALKSNRRVKIVVDGEEDLLTLIAILHAPDNAFVVYGQPHEGIVLVKVTPEKKVRIAGILKAMEGARKPK
jgi:uncharacterized protein (UPF0218 family)